MGIGTSPGPESLKVVCAEVALEIWKESVKQMPPTFPSVDDAVGAYTKLYFKILDLVVQKMLIE